MHFCKSICRITRCLAWTSAWMTHGSSTLCRQPHFATLSSSVVTVGATFCRHHFHVLYTPPFCNKKSYYHFSASSGLPSLLCASTFCPLQSPSQHYDSESNACNITWQLSGWLKATRSVSSSPASQLIWFPFNIDQTLWSSARVRDSALQDTPIAW